jgi:peptidoglycan/LPS O-acetylase OafA/YrhL
MSCGEHQAGQPRRCGNQEQLRLRAADIPFFAWPKAHVKLASGLVVTLLQAWVPPAALTWNPVAWSLSVEALFCLLFPFLLLTLFHNNDSNHANRVGGFGLC